MEHTIHQRIRVLIEETNDAFSSYGSMNGDYADFATLALSDFKTILSDPSLTRTQLKTMIRDSMTKCRNSEPECNDTECWANLMARYVTKSANSNAKENT